MTEQVENVYIGIDPCASGEITALELYIPGPIAPEKVLPEPLQNDVVSGKTPNKRSHSSDKDSTMESKKKTRTANRISVP